MHALVDIQTRFHIDFDWWASRHRNLGRFLAEILGEDDATADGDAARDVIDVHTAEVIQVDPLWARVIQERAHRPDYIMPSTPMANAVLRALVENLNRPMNAIELQRRIDRSTPETVLKVLRAARVQYGIVPLTGAGAPGATRPSAPARVPARTASAEPATRSAAPTPKAPKAAAAPPAPKAKAEAPSPEPKAKPKPKAKETATSSKPGADAKIDAKAKPKAKPSAPKPDAKAKKAGASQSDSKAKPKAKAAATQPDAKAKAEVRAKPEAKAKPEPKAKAAKPRPAAKKKAPAKA